MLTLNRTLKEGKNTLIIGDNIRIILLDIVSTHQVKIGIEAPTDINIRREEVPDDGRRR